MLPSIAEKYGLVPGLSVIVFDPATMMATSLAATAAGTAMSASSTIAGGKAQQAEAGYEANQITENASSDIGAAQQRMLDTQLKTNLMASSATARAAGNGVNAGVGSPVAIAKGIAQRGSYQSMMDLWQGQNQYTGDLNKAAAVQYGGNIAEQGADLKAYGTIAGGAGQMISQYGNYKYPRVSGGSYG